ncbi:hypothetical protein MMPV_006229 [Pyropia vietnamensis]
MAATRAALSTSCGLNAIPAEDLAKATSWLSVSESVTDMDAEKFWDPAPFDGGALHAADLWPLLAARALPPRQSSVGATLSDGGRGTATCRWRAWRCIDTGRHGGGRPLPLRRTVVDGAGGDYPPAADPSAAAAAELAQLRERLASAEAALVSTQTALAAARGPTTEHAALSAPPAGNAANIRGAAKGGGPGGLAPTDGTGGTAPYSRPPAASADPVGATAAGLEPPAAPYNVDGTSLDDADLAAVLEQADVPSDNADDWAPRQFPEGWRGRAACEHRLDDASAYDEGFDFAATFTPDDYLRSFDVPRSVLRADYMPMPFTPCDPAYSAIFTTASRDEIEARHW